MRVPSRLEVRVHGAPAAQATPRVFVPPDGWIAPDAFDARAHAWFFDRLPEGPAWVAFTAPGLRAEVRPITVRPGGARIDLYPAPLDPEFGLLPRGDARIPFRLRTGSLGIIASAPRLRDILVALQGRFGVGDPDLDPDPPPGVARLIVIPTPKAVRRAAVEWLRAAGVTAGPLVSPQAVLSNVALVRLHGGVRPADALPEIADQDWRSSFDPIRGLFRLEAPRSSLEEVCDYVGRLSTRPGVAMAECLIGFPVRQHGLPTTMDPHLWDRIEIGALDAWNALGAKTGANVVVGVIDLDFPNPGNASLAAFGARYLGRRVAGTPPTVLGANPHGVNCMGVIAASGGPPPIVGVAPECRIFGQLVGAESSPGTTVTIEDEEAAAILGAAGLRVGAPTPAADVLSASIIFAVPAIPSSEGLLAAAKVAGLRGRDGRGTPLFVSTGNDGGVTAVEHPFVAQSPFAWGTGAITHLGARPGYSNYGSGLAWCAPSSDDIAGNHGLWTPSNGKTTWPDRGGGPRVSAAIQDVVSLPAPSSIWKIVLSGAIAVDPGVDRVLLVPPGAPAPPAGTPLLDHLWTHQTGVAQRSGDAATTSGGSTTLAGGETIWSGAPVSTALIGGVAYIGAGGSRSNFGRTSAANAVAAGVGALVLAADERLTSVEVREIVATSATSLSPPSDFGAGRVDALAAVNLAAGFYGKHRARLTDLRLQAGAVTITEIETSHTDVKLVARVEMTGAESNLDLWVRFYIASATPDPTFAFPARWTPSVPVSLAAWPAAAVAFVDEVMLPAGSISAPGFLDVAVPLPTALYPPNSIDPHALVELAPYHHETAQAPSDGLRTTPIGIAAWIAQRFAQIATNDALAGSSTPLVFEFRVVVTAAVALGLGTPLIAAVATRRDGTIAAVPVVVTGTTSSAHELIVRAQVTLDASQRWVDLSSTYDGDTITHRVEVDVPSDVMLVIDYSGSMRQASDGVTKWEAVSAAAGLFAALHDRLGPSVAPAQRLGAVLFSWDSGASTFQEWPLADGVVGFAGWPGLPPAANQTPITDALLQAAGAMTAPGYRQRSLVLLTDGLENSGLHSLADLTTDHATLLPSQIDDGAAGFDLYPVAFGPEGRVDHLALSALVQDFDAALPAADRYFGRFHWISNFAAASMNEALLTGFADVVADLVRAERVDAVDQWIVVEPGVVRAVFVGLAATMTVTDPNGTIRTAIGPPPVALGLEFCSVAVEGDLVSPGLWHVSTTARAFALVDLQLRARFGVVGGTIEAGEPVRFFADVDDAGRPVSGASLRVQISHATESLGERLVAHRGLAPAKLSARQVRRLGVRGVLARSLAEHAEPPRRVEVLTLNEVRAGRYEALWAGTAVSGTIAARFFGGGATPAGAAWRRDARRDFHVAARPDPLMTRIEWSFVDGRWRGRIRPRTHTGRLLGPGLSTRLDLYSSARARRPLRVVDLTDGEYLVIAPRRWRDRPPPVEMRADGTRALLPIVTGGPPSPLAGPGARPAD